MVTCEEKFKLLQYLDRSLTCTYPTEALTKAIRFDKRFHIKVDVSIMANGKFLFGILLHDEYTSHEVLTYEEIVKLINYKEINE